MNRKRIYFTVLFLLFVASSLSIYSIYAGLRLIVEKRDEIRIKSQLELAKRQIQDFFDNYTTLEILSQDKHIVDWDGFATERLNNAAKRLEKSGVSITRIDENGKIVFTSPHKTSVGKFVGDQPHNDWVLKNKQKYLSRVFYAVQGFNAIAMANPVFNNKGQFKGILTMLYPYQNQVDKYFSKIKYGKESKLFILNQDNEIVFSNNIQNLSKNYKDIPSLGFLDSLFTGSSNSALIKVEVPEQISEDCIGYIATDVVHFSETQYWRLVIFVPSDSIFEIPNHFASKFGIVIVLLFIFLTISTYIIYEVDRKRKDEVFEKQKLFRSVAYKTRNVIYQYDMQTKKTKFTGDTQTVLGYNEEELSDLDCAFWKDMLVEDNREYYICNFDESKPKTEKSYQIRKKDGEIIFIMDSSALIYNKKGKITEKIGALKDITYQKEIEAELVKYQDYLEDLVKDRTDKLNEITKNLEIELDEKKQREAELIEATERAEKADRLKTEFLAQMSHEIRTPVNTMVNFAGMIQMEMEDNLPDDLLYSLKAINNAGERIVRTVELILNTSELQTGTFEVHPARYNLYDDILRKLIIEFQVKAEAKNIQLNFETKVVEPIVTCDEFSVRQIFSNLLDNAIKYTDEGSVTISISRNSENKIIVSVEDTGIGISEEYLPHIFETFSQENQGYTRRFEGNGLGMSLVKKYCELNNFNIEVQTEVNKGTRFTIRLES